MFHNISTFLSLYNTLFIIPSYFHMASFDLKPMYRRHRDKVPDHARADQRIIFTAPRNQVPMLLQDRVSLSTWMATYDAVVEQYEFLFDQSTRKRRMIVPWLIPSCRKWQPRQQMSSEQLRQASEANWLAICQEQQRIYRSAGILVTIATELKLYREGNDSIFRREMVGLHFEIPSQTNIFSRDVPASSLQEMKQQSENRKELDLIIELHQAGRLSDQEFAKAKARLLIKQ
jgi:hypothetical protein